jgi:hypothetical protein
MLVIKERLGDPVLTYSNLVKQAIKFRNEHMADCNSLQNVLSRMVHQSSWIPSRELLRNGVPRELHEIFLDRVTKRQRDYDWMKPHVPSDDKQKWLDRVDHEPIICRDPTPGGNSLISPEDYKRGIGQALTIHMAACPRIAGILHRAAAGAVWGMAWPPRTCTD